MTSEIILQAIVTGLMMGLIYALIAAGLSLIFGLMDIVNFAHGEIIALGAIATLFLSSPVDSRVIFLDRFSGTMAGNTPRSERKSMTFGLNNIFQAKVKKGDEEKKIDLLRINM